MGFEYAANLPKPRARTVATELGISVNIPLASLPAEVTRLRATILRISQHAWTAPLTPGQISRTDLTSSTWHVLSIALPSRSDIPIILDVLNGFQGQQITYPFILRATYGNSWADMARVFNCIWHGPSWLIQIGLDK